MSEYCEITLRLSRKKAEEKNLIEFADNFDKYGYSTRSGLLRAALRQFMETCPVFEYEKSEETHKEKIHKLSESEIDDVSVLFGKKKN